MRATARIRNLKLVVPKARALSIRSWTPRHVATVPLENRKKINFEWYTSICLPEILVKYENRQCKIIIHHGNANSRTSAQTIQYLSSHLAYSPDLAPNDFFLLPYMKNKCGQRFSTPEAVDAFKLNVLEIPQSKWKMCYENRFKYMQKCIGNHGKHFEKQ
ncbi:putative mariner transposase [Caerostris darwini]|uniref:Mariner transposase n=1 Tax=Caerostris darwini TaxID=1538125 RepID=A0AAV4MV64_9ARAC|nr:putative mariner transposase [Caerostris darwini]